MAAHTSCFLLLLLHASRSAALAFPPRAARATTAPLIGLPRGSGASNRSMLGSVEIAARLRADAGVVAGSKRVISTVCLIAPSSQKLGSRLSPVSASTRQQRPAAPSPTGVLQRCTKWMLAVVTSKLHLISHIFSMVGHARDGTENKDLQQAQAATAVGLVKNLVLTFGKGIIGFTANSQV